MLTILFASVGGHHAKTSALKQPRGKKGIEIFCRISVAILPYILTAYHAVAVVSLASQWAELPTVALNPSALIVKILHSPHDWWLRLPAR